MKPSDIPIQPDDDPGLIRSVRQLVSDLIEYGEARYRLIQAEMKVSIGRYGAAASLGGIAAVFAVIGYLPLMVLAILYLSQTWFDGTFIMPLTLVSGVHFAIAIVLTLFAWSRWKITQEVTEEEAKVPPLEANLPKEY